MGADALGKKFPELSEQERLALAMAGSGYGDGLVGTLSIKPDSGKTTSSIFLKKMDQDSHTPVTIDKLEVGGGVKPTVKPEEYLGDLVKPEELTELSAINITKFDKITKQPYDPKIMKKHLEAQYSGEKVTSSTLPTTKMPNVKLAGQKHSKSDIVFDVRGFPIFDSHAIYDTRIPLEVASVKKSEIHMRAATIDLKEKILAGKIYKSIFTESQLEDIMAGKSRINEFTWHHHQDKGRMQLIKRDLHKETGHIGGMDLWFEE